MPQHRNASAGGGTAVIVCHIRHADGCSEVTYRNAVNTEGLIFHKTSFNIAGKQGLVFILKNQVSASKFESEEITYKNGILDYINENEFNKKEQEIETEENKKYDNGRTACCNGGLGGFLFDAGNIFGYRHTYPPWTQKYGEALLRRIFATQLLWASLGPG